LVVLSALAASSLLTAQAAPRVLLGGGVTVHDATTNAFGLPAPGLDRQERRDFAVGNSLFKQNWVTAPAGPAARDGLGPLFHARSCSACHFRDGRSRPPESDEVERSGLLLRIGIAQADGPDLPHPIYGAQLQDRAIQGVRPEANVAIAQVAVQGTYGDGSPFELLRPRYVLSQWGYGDPGPGLVHGARVAPHIVGLGLLEAIPEAALSANADPEDRNGDGISGRAHHVDGRIGRFGWKATQADVASQTAAALVNDMGITSPLHPEEALTPRQRDAFTFVSGGSPEISPRNFDLLVLYTRALAVPAQRDAEDPQVVAGAVHFERFGCSQCHISDWQTADVAWHPAFAKQRIHPYTDLLLHDMGPELADGKNDGDARPEEWRTPPLWGIGLVPTVNGHSRYLHDGRARSLAEAILWHGGEAMAARERFRNAPAEHRRQLLAFVESL
jgi:CxxC motif-containing protein (DUF1111 family)